jgi:hypothetical protein
MCPRGIALHHPAAATLLQYAMQGCPVNTGKDWTIAQMEEAIRRGPHALALLPAAMEQLARELEDKIKSKQARVLAWDDIRDLPTSQLKISPLAMVPHKSRGFRAILDLSFSL